MLFGAMTNNFANAKTVLPNLEPVHARFLTNDFLNDTTNVEAAVIRLVKAKGYAPEVLYWDDGSLISLLTAGAVDRDHNTLVAGGVFEKHFIVCKIDY